MSRAEERFWSKVDKTHACWLWTAATDTPGYGLFYLDGKLQGAHRVSYVWANGPIPEGLVLDHLCHTASCVRPTHLRLATRKQNGEHRKGAPKNNTSGYRGVSAQGKKWVASVMHHGVAYISRGHLTPEDANQVAEAMRKELFTHAVGGVK